MQTATKKILKVTYPSVTSWTWHANLFAMIESMPEEQDWIYSNYIQVHCHLDERREGLFFEFFPTYASILACPLVHNQYIDRTFIENRWSGWKNFLIDCIDNDYYIYGVCNEKYLHHFQENFYHELFIFGYDLNENIFYCADFTFSNSGKYTFTQKPIEQVCRGFADVPDQEDYLLCGEGGIILSRLSPVKEKPYKIEVPYLKRNLTEYLEGRNSFKHYSVLYNTEPKQNNIEDKRNRAFGIDVYDVFTAYLSEFHDDFHPDYRAFHNLYEHKKLMVKRIEYLEKNHLIHQNINKEIYLKVENLSQILYLMIIKYHYKKDHEILEKMLRHINEIRNMEKEELALLLNSLK